MSHPAATVASSQVRIVHATSSDRDYEISIAFPFHHEDEPDGTWPVIYVLDGNLYFGLVADMVRAMNIRVDFCNELPDAFVVGIGYPVEGSLAHRLYSVMQQRMRDFLAERDHESEDFIHEHFPLEQPEHAGHTAAFLDFVSRDLVPLIDRDYRTDPNDRTPLGHSWGGTFAFYTMFRQPQLFQRYVIASSAPNPDDEAQCAREDSDLPVRLHLAMEQSEPHNQEARAFLATLGTRGYDNLRTSFQVNPTTHCAIVAPAFQSGLVDVFT